MVIGRLLGISGAGAIAAAAGNDAPAEYREFGSSCRREAMVTGVGQSCAGFDYV